MNKYVIFIKNGKDKVESKVLLKDLVTRDVTRELKSEGFTKHMREVEANNEREAIIKVNQHSLGYQKDLKEFSGNIVIISVVVITISIVYIIRNWL